MAKVFIYTIILATIVATLEVLGLGISSEIIKMFNFDDPSNWMDGTLVLALLLILSAATISGVVANFFGRSISESYFLSPLFAGFFVFYLIDMYKILSLINDNMTGSLSVFGSIFKVFIFAISAGYVISMIQFWRGNDI